MLQRGFFLLAAREAGTTHTVLAQMQQFAVTRRVDSLREAMPLLVPHSHWFGLVVDLGTVRDDAVETLAALRKSQGELSILARCKSPSVAQVNTLKGLRIEVVPELAVLPRISSFMRRALVTGWHPDARVAEWVDELAVRHNLTVREVQLAAYSLGHEPRARVRRRLGISENTLKTQVRGLLRKLRAPSLNALSQRLCQEAHRQGSHSPVASAPFASLQDTSQAALVRRAECLSEARTAG